MNGISLAFEPTITVISRWRTHTPFPPFNVGKHHLSKLLANWAFTVCKQHWTGESRRATQSKVLVSQQYGNDCTCAANYRGSPMPRLRTVSRRRAVFERTNMVSGQGSNWHCRSWCTRQQRAKACFFKKNGGFSLREIARKCQILKHQ